MRLKKLIKSTRTAEHDRLGGTSQNTVAPSALPTYRFSELPINPHAPAQMMNSHSQALMNKSRHLTPGRPAIAQLSPRRFKKNRIKQASVSNGQIGSLYAQEEDATENKGTRIRLEHSSGPTVSRRSVHRRYISEAEYEDIQKQKKSGKIDKDKRNSEFGSRSTPLKAGEAAPPGTRLIETKHVGGASVHHSRGGIENLGEGLSDDQVQAIYDLAKASDKSRPQKPERPKKPGRTAAESLKKAYKEKRKAYKKNKRAKKAHAKEHNENMRNLLMSDDFAGHRLQHEAFTRQRVEEDKDQGQAASYTEKLRQLEELDAQYPHALPHARKETKISADVSYLPQNRLDQLLSVARAKAKSQPLIDFNF